MVTLFQVTAAAGLWLVAVAPVEPSPAASPRSAAVRGYEGPDAVPDRARDGHAGADERTGLPPAALPSARPDAAASPSSTSPTPTLVTPPGPTPATPPSELPAGALPRLALPVGGSGVATVGSTRTVAGDDVRRIEVSTSGLGEGSDADRFRHAGGRTAVSGETIRETGAASVSEALANVPGVRASGGTSAQASGPGVLNVAVRGVNPRLSDRTTVLLDELPIAMAPYGQPQISLFPVSMFSIAEIDVVRGGPAVRFGPRTGGGVFNLRTREIPDVPTISTFGQVDQWGQAEVGASYAGRHGPPGRGVGVRAEYAPSFGRTYRDGSRFVLHGGLLKLEIPLARGHQLDALTHGGWQETELPGGLSVPQYEDDPFQNTRPFDERSGWRVGQGLTYTWRPRADHELRAVGYYNHTLRSTALEQQTEGTLLEQPRTYDAFGFEPRYALRLGRRQRDTGPMNDLGFGARVAFETAAIDRITTEAIRSPNPVRLPAQRSEGRLVAGAAFVENDLWLLDDELRLSAGVRGEVLQIASRDADLAIARTYGAALPAGAVWWNPLGRLAVFVGYGRAFTAPDFIEVSQETDTDDLDPEFIDSLDAGVKIDGIVGLYLDMSAFLKDTKNLRDPGLLAPDRIGDARAWGVETELEWYPGDIWDGLEGTDVNVGHAWVDSTIYREDSPGLRGKRLPWFPEHEVWAGAAYSAPWSCGVFTTIEVPDDCRLLRLGFDVAWTGQQFTEFTNATLEPSTGTTGPIADYLLMDVFVRWRSMLPGYWPLEVAVGVRNVLDERWFERSDDLNGGRILQDPRTFYVNIGVSHYFVRAWERARERAAQERRTVRWGRWSGGSGRTPAAAAASGQAWTRAANVARSGASSPTIAP